MWSSFQEMAGLIVHVNSSKLLTMLLVASGRILYLCSQVIINKKLISD